MEDLEVTVTNPDPGFWRGKRVLVTGHTGFKGGWLTLWLHRMGASVAGIGLPPNTAPALFELAGIGSLCDSRYCDIRDAGTLAANIAAVEAEIVFHLAAQPLVRASYEYPLATYATNVMGTANVLEALRAETAVRAVVMITTDKVYRNSESNWPLREDDALGGHDPYSASKAACEIVIDSYRKAFLADQGVALASARAGNVIGGDWAADRLIPDAVRAWQAGDALEIRRPTALRPWQHVLEPLAGYLVLAQRLWENAELAGAYNFGPLTHEAASVRDVVELARVAYGKGEVRYGDGTEGLHEADRLALEIAKARQALCFQPRFALAEAVRLSMAWYRSQSVGADARQLCAMDIAAWEATV